MVNSKLFWPMHSESEVLVHVSSLFLCFWGRVLGLTHPNVDTCLIILHPQMINQASPCIGDSFLSGKPLITSGVGRVY